jgi:hypothetical protein
MAVNPDTKVRRLKGRRTCFKFVEKGWLNQSYAQA